LLGKIFNGPLSIHRPSIDDIIIVIDGKIGGYEDRDRQGSPQLR
jgi:hypothetical protein